jgi:hypothetical protein
MENMVNSYNTKQPNVDVKFRPSDHQSYTLVTTPRKFVGQVLILEVLIRVSGTLKGLCHQFRSS